MKSEAKEMVTRSFIFFFALFLFYGTSVNWVEGNPILSKLPNAPNFVLKDVNGNKVTLSDFKGKIVMLVFWATWCPPCRVEMPHLVDLYATYRSKGVEVVGIALEPHNVKGVKEYVQKNRINYPILIGDDKVSSDYWGISSIPTTFMITQDGKVFRGYEGYVENLIFEKDIKSLLGK